MTVLQHLPFDFLVSMIHNAGGKGRPDPQKPPGGGGGRGLSGAVHTWHGISKILAHSFPHLELLFLPSRVCIAGGGALDSTEELSTAPSLLQTCQMPRILAKAQKLMCREPFPLALIVTD